MRKSVWMVCLMTVAMATMAQEKFGPPDHTRANIDGLQGVMFASAIENNDGEWDPVHLDGCKVYLAPGTALHERFSFPCNAWFRPPSQGSYLVWLATEDSISTNQTVFMARDVPYEGVGSVAIHGLKPAGYATVDVPVPPDHTVRFVHLDAPGLGFSQTLAALDSRKRFPLPPGRVVAGIFDAHGDAVAYHRPLIVKAGEATVFHITPPERGSDLLVILGKPKGHRDGPPLEVVMIGDERKVPDILLDQRRYAVAIWYGLPGQRVTISATSSRLYLKREIVLRPQAVITVRADLEVEE